MCTDTFQKKEILLCQPVNLPFYCHHRWGEEQLWLPQLLSGHQRHRFQLANNCVDRPNSSSATEILSQRPLTVGVNRFTCPPPPRRLAHLWSTPRKAACAGPSKRGEERFQAPLLVFLGIVSHEDLTETLDDPVLSLGGGLGGRRAGARCGRSGGAAG